MQGNDDGAGTRAGPGRTGAASPPPTVMALGYAGLLPPLPGIVLRASDLWPDPEVSGMLLLAGLVYGGLILSFLGGTWWGAACARRTGDALAPWLQLAVMPSLLAWLALAGCVANARVGGALLGIAIVATLLVDRKLVANAMVPAWWMRLRVPLSCGLATEMIVAGLLV